MNQLDAETTLLPPRRLHARPRWRRRILWALALLIAVGFVKFLLHLLLPRDFHASGEMLPLRLAGGPQQVPYYCQTPRPKGIVILGTGDGGWSYWEENTAQSLSKNGYAVGGWDCRKFADSRQYDHDQLVAGFNAAVQAVRERSRTKSDAPIWYGGWSTGAEQAVAAAASAKRPAQLRGLWLAAPGKRGRFGLTTSDLLGKMPTGPGTWSLAEMGPQLKKLPVVQFVAGLDPLDDVSWLNSYDGPKRVIKLSGLLHDMGGAGQRFQNELLQSLTWTLNPKS
jgi:pimeloyl-ACP methyl ester carboxylesterase